MKNEIGGACSTYARDERYIQDFWWGNLNERDHLEDLRIDGWMILKLIFKERNGVCTVVVWLRIKTGGGFCECGNEPSGSVK
jgi:hypothetical protein